jgi:hypothetical protein
MNARNEAYRFDQIEASPSEYVAQIPNSPAKILNSAVRSAINTSPVSISVRSNGTGSENFLRKLADSSGTSSASKRYRGDIRWQKDPPTPVHCQS